MHTGDIINSKLQNNGRWLRDRIYPGKKASGRDSRSTIGRDSDHRI